MQATNNIIFGPFRFDLADECLWQGARAISLRPKAYAVLKLLVEHPGRLVTKQQVLNAVWPDTFVGDAVLKDNIRQLREALDDDARSPSYIETAHRRGYRFIGRVSEPVASRILSTSASAPALDGWSQFSLFATTTSVGGYRSCQCISTRVYCVGCNQPLGVEREISCSSAVMSTGMSANRGVLK